MTLLTNSLKYILLLFAGLIKRLSQLITPSLLTYAPAGWDTVFPVGTDTGWDAVGVSQLEGDKWAAFCKAVAGGGTLGFSHEHTDLKVTDCLSFHNINITFGYVMARAAYGKTSLSVLDFGGGLGHYFQIGKALLPDLTLHYSCKDFPRMVALGKKLNPDIHWFTDDSCLKGHYDLVVVSGSLQYVRQWQQLLCNIATVTEGYMFLTQVPVINSADSFVSVQNAYGTQMLHWQFNRAELLHVIDSAGFAIDREFLAGECPHIRNAPEQCNLRGWLLKKKQNNS